MSRARPNWSASIQRKLALGTLPRAKLQKPHAALQALVTATLQSAGPPRRRSVSVSNILELFIVRQPSSAPPCSAHLDSVSRHQVLPKILLSENQRSEACFGRLSGIVPQARG